MMAKQAWTPSDLAHATLAAPPPRLSILEFQDRHGEWHNFDILVTKDRVVFGGYCNVGYMESGYIEREEFEPLDETLSELLSDLETYYNDGPDYVSRIVCNERM